MIRKISLLLLMTTLLSVGCGEKKVKQTNWLSEAPIESPDSIVTWRGLCRSIYDYPLHKVYTVRKDLRIEQMDSALVITHDAKIMGVGGVEIQYPAAGGIASSFISVESTKSRVSLEKLSFKPYGETSEDSEEKAIVALSGLGAFRLMQCNVKAAYTAIRIDDGSVASLNVSGTHAVKADVDKLVCFLHCCGGNRLIIDDSRFVEFDKVMRLDLKKTLTVSLRNNFIQDCKTVVEYDDVSLNGLVDFRIDFGSNKFSGDGINSSIIKDYDGKDNGMRFNNNEYRGYNSCLSIYQQNEVEYKSGCNQFQKQRRNYVLTTGKLSSVSVDDMKKRGVYLADDQIKKWLYWGDHDLDESVEWECRMADMNGDGIDGFLFFDSTGQHGLHWVPNGVLVENGKMKTIPLSEKLPHFDRLLTGDFDDNGCDDVLVTVDSSWVVYWDGQRPETVQVEVEPHQIAVGNFDGFGDDVFVLADDGSWMISSGANQPFKILNERNMGVERIEDLEIGYGEQDGVNDCVFCWHGQRIMKSLCGTENWSIGAYAGHANSNLDTRVLGWNDTSKLVFLRSSDRSGFYKWRSIGQKKQRNLAPASGGHVHELLIGKTILRTSRKNYLQPEVLLYCN